MKQLLILFFLLFTALSFDPTPVDLASALDEKMVITVSGAVERPGKIELPMYATIDDALKLVKPLPDADLSALNPQIILNDKDVLNVPVHQEQSVLKVSINTATVEQLQQLPGVGPSTAQRIVEHRETHGLFQAVEELMEVKGIGPSKYEKLEGNITL